jgi:signal transduction histidine kinase/ligand-binding sensor domain-containing protein/DNA-binding response OmpR family regulator
MKFCNICLLTFFFFLIFPLFLYPQSQDLIFDHLTVEDGLSYSKVISILQDHTGIMWFGTLNGLNKYDGYNFTVYKNNPDDSTSLSNNWINAIYEDKDNQLWIGTVGGLNKYDRNTDSFIRYVKNRDDSTSLITNVIYSLFETEVEGQNTLWIGALNAIHRYNPQKDNFKHYFPEANKENLVMNVNAGRSFTQTGSGKIWLGTWNEGLFYYDFMNDQFNRYESKPEYSKLFTNKRVRSIYSSQENQKDVIWMATYLNGLYKIEIESGRISNYLNQKSIKNKVKPTDLWTIYPDHNAESKILWIGSNQGLYKFNTESEQFFHYTAIPENPNSLNSNIVWAVYKDRSGILWVGTERGINLVNPQKSNFVTIKPLPGLKNGLNDKIIRAIAESDINGKKILWLGTANNGVNKYDRETGQFTYLNHDPINANSLTSDFITTILIPKTGNQKKVWIGTAHGLNIMDISIGRNKRIYFKEKDALYTPISCMCEDKDGNIWIGTRSSMIYCFSPSGKKITVFNAYREIYALCTDSFDNLWIGTLYGLKKYDLKSGNSKWFRNIQNDSLSIIDNDVISIYEDKNKVLWIGTSGGLNKYNRINDTFMRFTESDGLPNNNINAMLEDDEGNLWISTSKGISKFNPENTTFKNFDAGDGLQGDQFKHGSAFKNNDGEMFFGGINGFTMFHPDSISDNPYIPPTLLTDFQIYNKSVRIGKNSLIKKHISEIKEITLPYDQSVFSFEFAALDYHNPKKNKYAYKMEGVDPDWVFTDASRRFATYTNLDPEEYVFKVKGSNNDGIWNEEGTSVKVIILPPWWRTNWAYTIYIIFFGLIVFGFLRFQTNRLKMKQQMEMEHFAAEKLREVDKLKSHFFANISHEFRTPLTLIKGPVKQMLGNETKGDIKEQYKMILRNSDRLLGLINQILDLSKMESGEIKLKVQQTDIVKYVKDLVLSFSSLAERKKISLNLDIKDKKIFGLVDHDKTEKIVTNLLSNALKFTPEGGAVEVVISNPPVSPLMNKEGIKGGSEGCIQITISNTGPCIPADKLDKIFDRFYQADDNYKKDSEGSGVGLALTKELVEVCYGKIAVESIPEKTNTFTITLPIAKECFKEDEIVCTPLSPPLERRDNWGGYESVQETIETVESKPISGTQKSAPLLLIVEDNPDVTNYICSFMESEYRIITAENGNIGLKKAIDKYPELVISDVMMPEMDGFELCQKIKTDERISHIPVILLTAKADLASRIEGLEFGADDYISKPFEADELKIRSKNLIAQRKKLREKFTRLADLQPNEIAITTTDEKFLNRLTTVFENNISNPDLTTEILAKELGMSRWSLDRKLKAISNHSTHEFIRSLRLKKAAQLLKDITISVAEVAYLVGFNNTSHFAKSFRQQFGTSPGKYAEKSKTK